MVRANVMLPGRPGARLVLVQAELLLAFLGDALNPVALHLPVERPPYVQGRRAGRGVAEAILDVGAVQLAGNEQVQVLRLSPVAVFPAPDRDERGLPHQRPVVARPVAKRLPGGGRQPSGQRGQGQGRTQRAPPTRGPALARPNRAPSRGRVGLVELQPRPHVEHVGLGLLRQGLAQRRRVAVGRVPAHPVGPHHALPQQVLDQGGG